MSVVDIFGWSFTGIVALIIVVVVIDTYLMVVNPVKYLKLEDKTEPDKKDKDPLDILRPTGSKFNF